MENINVLVVWTDGKQISYNPNEMIINEMLTLKFDAHDIMIPMVNIRLLEVT